MKLQRKREEKEYGSCFGLCWQHSNVTAPCCGVKPTYQRRILLDLPHSSLPRRSCPGDVAAEDWEAGDLPSAGGAGVLSDGGGAGIISGSGGSSVISDSGGGWLRLSKLAG